MINKKNENTTATSSNKYEVTVTRAREIKKTEKEQVIAFDVNVNGVTIYGMIYRSGVSNKGKEYELYHSRPAREQTILTTTTAGFLFHVSCKRQSLNRSVTS